MSFGISNFPRTCHAAGNVEEPEFLVFGGAGQWFGGIPWSAAIKFLAGVSRAPLKDRPLLLHGHYGGFVDE
ncbi:MAG: hypothetical protein ACI9OD_003550 [Limisphaerales bacterium]